MSESALPLSSATELGFETRAARSAVGVDALSGLIAVATLPPFSPSDVEDLG